LETIKTSAKQREDFLTNQVRRFAVETAAKIAIKEAGPIDGADIVLLPHVMGAMEMIEEGEGDTKQIVVRVVDPATKAPRYVGSELMTPSQFVEELKNKPGFGGNFKADAVGGGGAPPQSRGAGIAKGTTLKRSTFDTLSPDQQRQHVIDGGKIVD
jgi:hypothetical protein